MRGISEKIELEFIKPEPRGLREPSFSIGVAILLVSCLVTVFVLVPQYAVAAKTHADTGPITSAMAALISGADIVSFVGIIWRATTR